MERFALASLLFALTLPVSAVVPESGMYWNEQQPGRGYYIEHQNGQVAVAIYAYDEVDGEPEFYTAAGVLRDDAEPIEPLSSSGNLYPVHGVAAPLFRTSGGACVFCNHKPPLGADRVGFITIAFPDVDTAHIVLTSALSRQVVLVRRIEFGLSRLYYPGGPPDLRGQWVLVDELDPGSAPSRYHFSERVTSTDSPSQSAEGYAVSYFDRLRGVELRCTSPNVVGLSRADAQMLPRVGCELWEDGQVRWSVVDQDIGLYRMQASRERLPRGVNRAYRGAGRLIGVRIESR